MAAPAVVDASLRAIFPFNAHFIACMVTNTCLLILLDQNRRYEPLYIISTAYCLKDATRAIYVTMVSHPVTPASQTDTVRRLQEIQSLVTCWAHEGRLCGSFSLGKEVTEGWGRSLVSALSPGPLLEFLTCWCLLALQNLLAFGP